MDLELRTEMKLLFVFILLFVFLLLGSSMSREGKGEEPIADTTLEQSEILFPDAVQSEFRCSSRPAVMLRCLFLPGKQLDMPEDHGHAFHLSSKTLAGHRHPLLSEHVQMLYSQKFMRLLSARHINGFYIYSLEKLII